jgi:hypothetical protein
MHFKHALLLVAVLIWPLATSAHDKPTKGPNGGQLIHVDDAHYELVAKGNALILFVSDDSQAPRTSLVGTKATATALVAGKTVDIDLVPGDADALQGTGTFVAAKGLKVVVSIQEPGRKPAQIRFTPID